MLIEIKNHYKAWNGKKIETTGKFASSTAERKKVEQTNDCMGKKILKKGI